MSHRRVGTSTGNHDADLNAAQREGLAFTLRAKGYDFPAIASACGYANASGAYKAYRRAVSRIPRQAVEDMRLTVFAQQLLALKAMEGRIDRGDHLAIREMTAIHERMAKLFGLDMPVAADAMLAAKVMVRAYPPEWVNALPPPGATALPAPSESSGEAQP